MSKLTETEMLRHIAKVEADACELYGCEKKDLHLKVLKDDNIMVRLKNAAQRKRQDKE